MAEDFERPVKNIAVIGAGLAGLASAYQLLQEDPTLQLSVYEQGGANSYQAGSDDINRASLNASPARIMRMTGANDDVKRDMTRDTKAMLDNLTLDIAAHPESYDETAKQPLFTPQASVTILPDDNDDKYHKTLKSLQEANVAFEELSGAELKQRNPLLFQSVPDDSAVIYESPANAENPEGVAGIMNTPAILSALKGYVQRHGGQIKHGHQVKGVEQLEDGGVVVDCNMGPSNYDKAVIAPGQWIEKVIDTEKYNIQPRYDRVVQLQIDLKGLGLTEGEIPLVKGLNPEAGKNSLYSFTANPEADGQAKFISGNTTRTVESLDALRAPITAEETQKAINAAAETLGVEPDIMRKHATPYLCAYTSPRRHENQLVDTLENDIVINGLDSSATARISGGLGKIAAAHALEKDEPYKDSFDKFNLDAHHTLIEQPVEVKAESVLTRVMTAIKQTLGM